MSWHPGGPVEDPNADAGYSGRNRGPSKGGPSGVQRSSAAQLRENEPLFNTYEHLQGLPRGDAALHMLRKVASMVKPIMSKRNWKVQVLAEFLPPEQNLLGLNINKGYKICIRLRYHSNPDLFLPLEEVVDTMLHELSHNVWGEHDSNFHKLWDELRDEHEALVRKGYTGEGFLSEGRRLGGSSYRAPPRHEMRRLARQSAEKRKAHGTLGQGSGQRLGGTPLHSGKDARQVIADQVTRRNAINKGCGSGRKDAEKLSQEASKNTFKTKAEEDDANNRAIAQALFELMEDDERRKLHDPKVERSGSSGGLSWSPEHGLYDAGINLPPSNSYQDQPSEEEQMRWAMEASMEGIEDDVAAKPLLPEATTVELSRTTSAPTMALTTKSNDTKSTDATVKRKRPESTSTSPSSSTTIKHELARHQDIKQDPEQLIDLTTIAEEENTLSEDQWACEICTCINPLHFLACDACGVERRQSNSSKANQHPKSKTKVEAGPEKTPRWKMPPPSVQETMGWNCSRCGAFMEHRWWTCSACGNMKESS